MAIVGPRQRTNGEVLNLDQAAVDRWLDEFLARLHHRFGERLVFVAHHGSWARGEATPDSDIDCFVILDQIEDGDLETYGELICSMSDGGAAASTFMGSVAELKAWPRQEQWQCRYGARVLHGSPDGVVIEPTGSDLVADIRWKASANLHVARHYLLHPHDLPSVVHRLKYPFKECFYALQSWMLLTGGTYWGCKDDLLAVLPDSDDREAVRIARDWHLLSEDRMNRPRHYIETLERWSRKMLERVAG